MLTVEARRFRDKRWKQIKLRAVLLVQAAQLDVTGAWNAEELANNLILADN